MLQCHTDFLEKLKDNEKICSTNCPNSPHDAVPCFFKGPTLSNGYPSGASEASKLMKTVKPDVSKPLHVVNGYLNHDKDKATSAKHARTTGNRKQRSKFSAAGCVFVKGTTNKGCGLSTSKIPATEADPPSTTTFKKKIWRNKSRREVLPGGRLKTTQFILSQQPPEEEDWEKEYPADLEKRVEVQTCVPEDACVMALRDLTLEPLKNMPLTACYSPAVHHPGPLLLSCSDVAPEPEQFADADE
ncbi:uncharacterized protein LOC130919882 [Corythoichthys intestinalis]|uniref:uncharacterized protein LOC130919882 n=1 Tax=Corythoichthys intestinalis TaxID=161448 RepID=UPI0025A4FA4D|nr:uncharacterized protein LOC130919882 [Corythoichthys intestinalis]